MAPAPGTALDGLIEAVRSLIPDAGIVYHEADGVPPGPGSYLLLIELRGPLSVKTGKRDARLPAGLYSYAGSARGPGGLRGRLGRHLRGDGRKRWHIDQLTAQAATRAGFAFSTVPECDLTRRLLESRDFSVPVEGFGSSDCRDCAAHLLRFMPHPEN